MANREKIIELIQPKLDEFGCFLVDVKVNPSLNKYEVFIDNDEGVTIKVCEKISRYLAFNMDNDPDFPENYMLDVSSPGMDNPFKVMRQYLKSVGKMVEVMMMNGVKKEGVLEAVNEDEMKLAVHHPPVKKGMKPKVTEEIIPMKEIKSTSKKITF